MAREFGPVQTTIWTSKRFWKLKSDQHRLFYLYLIACPHGNSIGCFRLPKGYIAADLKWSPDAIDEAIRDCCETLLIAFDEAEEIVFISQYLAKSPLTNPNHAKSAIKAAAVLPDSELKMRVINDLERDKHAATLEELKAIKTVCEGSLKGLSTKLNDTKLNDTSEDKSSGAGAPLDDKTWLFNDGLTWLQGKGQTEPAARKLIGQWLKGRTPADVSEAVVQAMQNDPADPIAWVTATLNRKSRPRDGPSHESKWAI